MLASGRHGWSPDAVYTPAGYPVAAIRTTCQGIYSNFDSLVDDLTESPGRCLQNRPSHSYCRLPFIRYRHRYSHHDRIVHVDSRCSKERSIRQRLSGRSDFTLSDLAEMHSAQSEWLVGQYQDHDTWSWDNSKFSVGACMTFYDPSASEELISGYSSRVYFVENEELISTRRSKRKNRSTKSH